MALRAIAAALPVVSVVGDTRAAVDSLAHADGLRARVSGLVWDSIGGVPMAGARVQLTGVADSVEGQMYTARSDATGRYDIDDVRRGRYLAGFFHEHLDTLGLESAPVSVEVRSDALTLNLGSPSPRTVIRALCSAEALSDTTALLIGHVRSTSSEQGIANATVSIEWGETLIASRRVRSWNRLENAYTQGPGWFAMCDVPSDVLLTVRAAAGSDTSGFIDVEVPHRGLRHLTIHVGGAIPVAVPRDSAGAAADSLAPPWTRTLWSGLASLHGSVVNERGEPVAGARAHVVGTSVDAVTNSNGNFALDSLPGGTQTLEVKSLGYLPTYAIVQLAEHRPWRANVQLTEPTAVLPTVRVRTRLVYAHNLLLFRKNRDGGYTGHYIGPEEIERRPSGRFSGLLQGVPGVRVSYNTGSAVFVMDAPGSESGAPIFCEPSIYIDGRRSRLTGLDLEALYATDDLIGIEIYTRDSARPTEFTDLNSRCGAIVVWTHPGRARRRQ